MDKQAYHYNKKKLKGKTPETYLYFYPCDPSDNPDKWIEGKSYAVIEVTERDSADLQQRRRRTHPLSAPEKNRKQSAF